MAKHKYEAHDIWNLDKTNDPTVNQPPKVIPTEGAQQIIEYRFHSRKLKTEILLKKCSRQFQPSVAVTLRCLVS